LVSAALGWVAATWVPGPAAMPWRPSPTAKKSGVPPVVATRATRFSPKSAIQSRPSPPDAIPRALPIAPRMSLNGVNPLGVAGGILNTSFVLPVHRFPSGPVTMS
jgi:hypothetical protein